MANLKEEKKKINNVFFLSKLINKEFVNVQKINK
jgi:hypothetical protein